MAPEKRKIHDDLKEIVGRSLYNFDLEREATYEELTNDAWIKKYQGRVKQGATPEDLRDATIFHARVDHLTEVLMDYVEREIL